MQTPSAKLTFLGYSAINLPLLMDLCFETFELREFIILKNITSDEDPYINLSQEFYQYSFLKASKTTNAIPLAFGVTNALAKKSVFKHFQKFISKSDFINIVHPKAYVASSALLSTGVLIEPLVSVSSQSELDFGITIKRNSTIGHHTKIGEFSTINPGCVISGNVEIGKGCTLGSGSVFRDSISIGDNSIIGAGSVVTKDIPANVVAFGNPCKIIKQL